ncbi:hypothetical protein NicSoilB8_05030 [Arthrobacter sp. NicSoilB8]|nr:hypothetical protein NicSoilB8_05030 [Arthrobacter sp. NicSoilB8]
MVRFLPSWFHRTPAQWCRQEYKVPDRRAAPGSAVPDPLRAPAPGRAGSAPCWPWPPAGPTYGSPAGIRQAARH